MRSGQKTASTGRAKRTPFSFALYAFSIMGIDGGSQVCVLENEGRYCLSFPKTSLD